MKSVPICTCFICCTCHATVDNEVYLENINLILAFIINMISQPIEHLNISSAFIEIHGVLFNTIDVYTAIKLNWLSVAWVAQWVEHVNIAHLYF